MELPSALRQAVDEALAGVPLAELARAAEALSRRYRAEARDGRFHLGDDLAARAYLATRLPATYAAVRAALAAVAERRPDFAPATVLDVGAGPGTATFAAADCWPSVNDALLLEASPAIRRRGEALAAAAGPAKLTWRADDLAGPWMLDAPRELVLLAYVLGEVEETSADALVGRLWAHTAGTLVLVEPGTPAGYGRILRARARLIGAGAHMVAPCPHALACPLRPPDWCHFARRLARSRLHRQAKHGEVPWEDEKYSYVAFSRIPDGAAPMARVLAAPRSAPGRVTLKLCMEDGLAASRTFTRREGAAFRAARRVGWGDPLKF